jgi:hypothetical protein
MAVLVALAIVAESGFSLALAQDSVGPTPTNLQMFQSLAARIGELAVTSIPVTEARSVAVVVTPHESAWTIEQELNEAFRGRGFKVLGAPSDSALEAEFGLADTRVTYANARTDGFLGQRVIDRTVRLTLRGKIVDRRTGALLAMKEWTEEGADVIGISRLESLETPGLLMTKGVAPPEGFFSGLLEPLVLLGAIAVAVVLLFSIRS